MDSLDWKQRITNMINHQIWLDRIAEPVQKTVNRFYAGSGRVEQGVENLLNGTPLGHPLHPALTDIPIGAWTATIAIDRLDRSGIRFGKAADASLLIGIASAAAAAVAGLTDWQHTNGEARRVGILHALINTIGLGVFISSYIARKAGNRGLGKGLALLGYLGVFFSAYLGGDLVFRQKIGVNHGQTRLPAHNFTPIIAAGDLRDGQLTRVDVDGVRILLLRRGEHVFAINEVCTHLGGPLAEGDLQSDNTVICPWHGSRFQMETGIVVDGPAAYPQSCYEARILNGQIEIRLPLEVRETDRQLASARM